MSCTATECWPELTAEPAAAMKPTSRKSWNAARSGCSDAALIRAAAGALSQALYFADLTRLAGLGLSHPFSIKKALFSGGHWPLGIVQGTYYVF